MAFKRGALIVLEGVDRSGKSTQSRLLVENLNKRNIPAQLVIFPDRSTLTGKLISEYLNNSDIKLHDKAIHLLFSANRWENVDKMKTMLYEGTTLVVDRYSYSGIAYSASKSGMDLEWCKSQENGLPKPDVVFLLKLNEHAMKNRPGFGGERYENNCMQKKVMKIYNSLMDSTWETLDGSDSIENISKLLISRVDEVREAVKNKELKELHFSNSKENFSHFNKTNLDNV